MANPNINIGVINESNLSSQITTGKILFTDTGKQYIVKTDGNKLKITDILFVSSLPITGLTEILYILTTNNTLNYYDSLWYSLGGGIRIWASGTNYKIEDMIFYNNNLYQCKSANSDATFTDVNWNLIGGNATSINNISIDNTTLSNGRGLFYNQSLNKLEWADVTVSGVVGSTQITTLENVTIGSGMEKVFNHPTSTNIVPVIEEQVPGSTVIDTHVDFSDSSKYNLQDSGKILIGSNKAELDIYTKLLMHMDEPTFKDECGHTITNNGCIIKSDKSKFGGNSLYVGDGFNKNYL